MREEGKRKKEKVKNKNPERFCVQDFLAEKEGFEPSHRLSQSTPLAGEPLRPLGYFSVSSVCD